MKSSSSKVLHQDQIEIQHYVQLMKEYGINTIVAMNKYISTHNMWDDFSHIRRENTYSSGFTSIGISIDAYKLICNLCKTKNMRTSSLVEQKRI